MADRSLTTGAYVVVAPNGAVFIERSEIQALRKAVATGGRHEFVYWGQFVGDTSVAATTEPKAAKPKAAKPAAAPAPVAIITEGAAVPASDF